MCICIDITHNLLIKLVLLIHFECILHRQWFQIKGFRAQPPSSLMLRGHTASKKWVLSDPSGEESTRFLLNLPRHNQLVSGEHNSPPNPNQRTPLAGGVPHTCAPLFLLSKWLLMTWLSRSRSFSDDIATSLMIKFWGNENSKSLIALDCPAKWWVHCCRYPH